MAQAVGVKFLPCQMTMDMFGIKAEDLVEGMGEPVGAATALQLMTEANRCSSRRSANRGRVRARPRF